MKAESETLASSVVTIGKSSKAFREAVADCWDEGAVRVCSQGGDIPLNSFIEGSLAWFVWVALRLHAPR